MRNLSWLVLTVTLAGLMLPPAALAAEEKAKSPLRGEYAIMASELKLSEQQTAEIAAKVKAKDDALAAWDKENGEKLKAAQEAVKKAREAKDKEAMKKAADEQKALSDARNKIQADGMAAIYAILTPEQKQQWDGFVLYRSMMARFRKANLTEEQQKKVRELAAVAAKDITVAGGDEKAAAKAKGEIQAKLQKDVEALLTAEQKAAMEAKPEKKPAEEKK